MSELPQWPREFRRGETINEWKAAEYERKRAEAALARLRLAVGTLETMSHGTSPLAQTARDTMAEIGALPAASTEEWK